MVGFALLIPPVRAAVFRYLKSKVKVQSFSMGGTAQPRQPDPRGPVIDGEWEEVSPPKNPTHPPAGGSSGWTRH